MKKTMGIIKALFTPPRQEVRLSSRVWDAINQSPWSVKKYEDKAKDVALTRKFIASCCVCDPQYWISNARLFFAFRVWLSDDLFTGQRNKNTFDCNPRPVTFENFALAALSTPGVENKDDPYDPYFTGIRITEAWCDHMDNKGMEA